MVNVRFFFFFVIVSRDVGRCFFLLSLCHGFVNLVSVRVHFGKLIFTWNSSHLYLSIRNLSFGTSMKSRFFMLLRYGSRADRLNF